MNVKDLISALTEFDSDFAVVLLSTDGMHKFFDLESVGVFSVKYADDKTKKTLVFLSREKDCNSK